MFGEEEEDKTFPNNPGNYNNLSSRSDGILRTDPLPVGVAWGSLITKRFQRTISLLLYPPQASVGFLYSSKPLVDPSLLIDYNPPASPESSPPSGAGIIVSPNLPTPSLPPIPSSALEANSSDASARQEKLKSFSERMKSFKKKYAHQPSFLLQADVVIHGIVQGMYVHRYPPHWVFRNQFMTCMDPGLSQLNSMLEYKAKSWTSSIAVDSQKESIHLNLLARQGNFAVGGDIAYTLGKAVPSYSMGVRYTFPNKKKSKLALTQLTLAYNSAGRVRTTYTREISKYWQMTTRYTVNVNDFRSNLTVGVERMPDENLPIAFRAKYNTTERGGDLSVTVPLGYMMGSLVLGYDRRGGNFGIMFQA
jgi:hypothetical protein